MTARRAVGQIQHPPRAAVVPRVPAAPVPAEETVSSYTGGSPCASRVTS